MITDSAVEKAIDIVLEKSARDNQKLQTAITNNDGTLLTFDEWSKQDNIVDLLKQDDIGVKTGKYFATVDSASFGYADIDGSRWFVSIGWKPLWKPEAWEDNIKEADPEQLYAIPAKDYTDNEADQAAEDLRDYGFSVGSFEGF